MPAPRESETPARKLVVVIPTRDRHRFLNLTLKSILEQARDHGHLKNLAVVVSDQSGEEGVKANRKVVARFNKKYGNKIHYFPPGSVARVARVLQSAPQEEQAAFERLVPEDGHWGAHRNRLSLLGALVAGRKFGLERALQAVYLHLDDDTPLLRLRAPVANSSSKIVSSDGRLTRIPEDVLGFFVDGFEQARSRSRSGFCHGFYGVFDAHVSQNGTPFSSLRGKLRTPGAVFRHGGSGPGRALDFNAFSYPYHPHGSDEDFLHSSKVRPAHSEYRRFENFVTHIGFKGARPEVGRHDYYRRLSPDRVAAWKSLAFRMAQFGAGSRRKAKRS